MACFDSGVALSTERKLQYYTSCESCNVMIQEQFSFFYCSVIHELNHPSIG